MPNYRVTIEPISEIAKQNSTDGTETYILDGVVLIGNYSTEEQTGLKNSRCEIASIAGTDCAESIFTFIKKAMPDQIKAKVGKLMLMDKLGILQTETIAKYAQEPIRSERGHHDRETDQQGTAL